MDLPKLQQCRRLVEAMHQIEVLDRDTRGAFDQVVGTGEHDQLPAGQTLDSWNAISIWCRAVQGSFGWGTFAPPVRPSLTATRLSNAVEVKLTGAPYAIEYDDEGTISISFVPIRPGNYSFFAPGFEDRGLKGNFVVR